MLSDERTLSVSLSTDGVQSHDHCDYAFEFLGTGNRFITVGEKKYLRKLGMQPDFK